VPNFNQAVIVEIVIQSSDFPLRRTGSYRHKKALYTTVFSGDDIVLNQISCVQLCTQYSMCELEC